MNNYLVTFNPEKDLNSEFAVTIRTTLENLSPDKWVQIFPFQIAIQSELTITELQQELSKIEKSQRVSIVRFDAWSTNEERSSQFLSEYGY
ncbi:hypothetical protein [Lactiplantibacillus plantarum]|uniref:hypothetical protein n=1 Tax=Lactiplantibacillus plantarum TaxID=1590 RepID=UPI003EC5B1A2